MYLYAVTTLPLVILSIALAWRSKKDKRIDYYALTTALLLPVFFYKLIGIDGESGPSVNFGLFESSYVVTDASLLLCVGMPAALALHLLATSKQAAWAKLLITTILTCAAWLMFYILSMSFIYS